MTHRYKEKTLSGSVISRQIASMLIADYDNDISTGEENLSLRFRTMAVTIDTSADTITGEMEVSPRSKIGDLVVTTNSLGETIDSIGTDPYTGADLSNLSKAGVLEWFKSLFDHELEKKINEETK